KYHVNYRVVRAAYKIRLQSLSLNPASMDYSVQLFSYDMEVDRDVACVQDKEPDMISCLHMQRHCAWRLGNGRIIPERNPVDSGPCWLVCIHRIRIVLTRLCQIKL